LELTLYIALTTSDFTLSRSYLTQNKIQNIDKVTEHVKVKGRVFSIIGDTARGRIRVR